MDTNGQQPYHSVEVVCPQGHTHDQVRVLGKDLFACVDCDHLFDDPQIIYFINSIVAGFLSTNSTAPPHLSTQN